MMDGHYAKTEKGETHLDPINLAFEAEGLFERWELASSSETQKKYEQINEAMVVLLLGCATIHCKVYLSRKRTRL